MLIVGAMFATATTVFVAPLTDFLPFGFGFAAFPSNHSGTLRPAKLV